MNILFISWTRIGDAILSTGVLHELTRRYPEARFTIVCGPLAQTLFVNVPGLARVIALPKKPLNAHWMSLWADVIGTHWDIVVDLRRSLTSYCLRAGKRMILGRADDAQHRVAWLPSIIGLSAPLNPYLWISDAQRAAAATLVPDGPPVLAIAPVAARPEKNWPAERFAALVKQLREGSCANWRVMVAAGPGEEAHAQPIIDTAPPERVIRLIGENDLLVVAAALARATLYIGNDSGLTHMAAAVGTPALALFGPTNPNHYGPWSEKACVVEAPLINGARTMAALDITAVHAAAVEMLRHIKLQ